MPRLTVARARRIALAAQGFADPKPKRVDVRQLRRAMDRMTILQLDSVNVLSRSHYLPMLARLGPYDRAKLDHHLYRSGEYFEYLSHEASIVSQDIHPLLRHRMRTVRWRGLERWMAEHADYAEAVYDEVVANGPVTAKDLSDPGRRTGPWWGMSKGKIALEYLYCLGRVAIAGRDDRFVTHFDLPERVIRPDVLALPDLDTDGGDAEAKRRMLMLGARSHGIGTDKDLADYFRLKVTECRPLLADLVAEGALQQVEVEGWDAPAYLHPEARHPRSVPGAALLSPFDPVVWFRPRAERLFNFFYRIEIYVPEPDRVYGYFVLPFLLDEELVGRVDLKADRKSGTLLVQAAHHEDGVDPARVATPLADSLAEMAEWLGLDSVWVSSAGNLTATLRQCV